ncbi:hypothetical protein XBKQ1_2360063 [Xenorhabdus bovienii str. kraussei Quebec]|uniref:Uncharacterized protein n=1 Tax=Xenorhabdus bovienii str. kraussei Quebec TaxID=1398203 RepID=A0A077P600_XENBV|nr:hypothetical protein [Xenorhabdus bovienii]CDH19950.1 hypothetical protein XBKQ1_2360063 [Xenorhabdus bovienii str. kraussei Quebec]
MPHIINEKWTRYSDALAKDATEEDKNNLLSEFLIEFKQVVLWGICNLQENEYYFPIDDDPETHTRSFISIYETHPLYSDTSDNYRMKIEKDLASGRIKIVQLDAEKIYRLAEEFGEDIVIFSDDCDHIILTKEDLKYVRNMSNLLVILPQKSTKKSTKKNKKELTIFFVFAIIFLLFTLLLYNK